MMTISGLLALFALACAVAAGAASRRCARLTDEASRIASALSSERSKIAQNELDISDLTGRFQQLQGRFYAERKKQLQREEEPERVDSAADIKARLRREIGLVPGRRPTP